MMSAGSTVLPPSRSAERPTPSFTPDDGKPLAWVHSGRIPSLDGFRAVSILLVLACHGFQTCPTLPRSLLSVAAKGAIGVDFFFVISGFLITLLLLREQERSGKVSLAGFYKRRMLRILPAWAVYLGFVFVLTRLGFARLTPAQWTAALTYTMNFVEQSPSLWVVGHLWSLSVEEHFYLLWPLTLALLGPKRSLRLLLVVIVLSPFVRCALFWKAPAYWSIDFVTPARLDTIGIGCLLAFLCRSRRGVRLAAGLGRHIHLVLLLSTALLVLSIGVRSRWWQYGFTLGYPLEACCIAVMLLAGASAPLSWAGRLLNCRFAAGLGILSYSLYLWQQPFLNYQASDWFCRWPINLVLAVAVALASYFLVERPFLNLKERTKAHGEPKASAPR